MLLYLYASQHEKKHTFYMLTSACFFFFFFTFMHCHYISVLNYTPNCCALRFYRWDVEALNPLEQSGSYVRIIFVDYSSAFSTVIPKMLISKLSDLSLPIRTCTWIKDFLTNCTQTVKLGPHLSYTITLNTGSRPCAEPNSVLTVHPQLHTGSVQKYCYQRWVCIVHSGAQPIK